MITTSQVQPGSSRLASGRQHVSELALHCGECSDSLVFLPYLRPAMTEEVNCLKLQLREKEEEIAALKKRLEQLETVRRSTSRSFIP